MSGGGKTPNNLMGLLFTLGVMALMMFIMLALTSHGGDVHIGLIR